MQLRCEVGGDGKLRLLLQRFLHGLSDDHMGITRVLIVAGIVLYVADTVLLQVKMPDEQCHAVERSLMNVKKMHHQLTGVKFCQ